MKDSLILVESNKNKPNCVLRLSTVVIDILRLMEDYSKTILGYCKSTEEGDVCVVQCKKSTM